MGYEKWSILLVTSFMYIAYLISIYSYLYWFIMPTEEKSCLTHTLNISLNFKCILFTKSVQTSFEGAQEGCRQWLVCIIYFQHLYSRLMLIQTIPYLRTFVVQTFGHTDRHCLVYFLQYFHKFKFWVACLLLLWDNPCRAMPPTSTCQWPLARGGLEL